MGWQDAVLRSVDDAETIQLAQELVAFPTFAGQEGECALAMAARLRELGFDEVRTMEVEPGRPNVVATMGPAAGRSFMFNGHLDIDPLPDDYDRPMFRTSIEAGVLWGTGLGNMKAGLASMIAAAVAVRRSGLPIGVPLEVALVVGELSGGIGTRHLIEHHPVPAHAIVPEPTGTSVRTVHAGCLQPAIRITTDGGSRTVAIDAAMRALDALAAIEWSGAPHPLVPGLPRLSVGGIVGGAFAAGVDPERVDPDACYLLIDIRTRPGQAESEILDDLRSTLDRAIVGDTSRYELELPPAPYRAFGANAFYQPPLDLAVDHPLALTTARWHRTIAGSDPNVGFDDPGSYACADTGWLFSAGTACLNYGPADSVPHHDRVTLEKLATATRVMALVAGEYCL